MAAGPSDGAGFAGNREEITLTFEFARGLRDVEAEFA
jgi:hypothetical protein